MNTTRLSPNATPTLESGISQALHLSVNHPRSADLSPQEASVNHPRSADFSPQEASVNHPRNADFSPQEASVNHPRSADFSPQEASVNRPRNADFSPQEATPTQGRPCGLKPALLTGKWRLNRSGRYRTLPSVPPTEHAFSLRRRRGAGRTAFGLTLLTALLALQDATQAGSPEPAASAPVITNALPWPERPLTLEDCLNIAIEQNPGVQKSRKDIEIAHGVSIQTRAIVLPKLQATGDYTARADSAVDMLEIPPGTVFPAGIPVIDPGNENWTAGVRVVQSIFEGGRMRSSLRTARLLKERALAGHQAVLADTATDVRVGFYNVLLGEQEITVSLASVDLLENELADSQRRFNAGTVPRFNVLRAEVELANARPRVSRARNSYRIAKNVLVNLLGYTVPQDVWEDIPLKLAGTLDAPKFEIAVPDAVRLALERRPELVALRHTEALQREGVTVARAGYYPRLEGFAGYGARKSVFTPDVGDYVHGWEAGVQAVWNIFDGAYTRGKVAEARAQLDKAGIETDDVTRQIELEVRTAYSTLVESWEVLESQQKTVEQAEEALRLARSRADAGAGTQLDVLSAQTALTEARTTTIRAKREYAVALTRLERAIGAYAPSATP